MLSVESVECSWVFFCVAVVAAQVFCVLRFGHFGEQHAWICFCLQRRVHDLKNPLNFKLVGGLYLPMIFRNLDCISVNEICSEVLLLSTRGL